MNERLAAAKRLGLAWRALVAARALYNGSERSRARLARAFAELDAAEAQGLAALAGREQPYGAACAAP